MKIRFLVMILSVVVFASSAFAVDLEVPIVEHMIEDLDICALAQVKGLKANGDGFLAVRTGSDTNYKKIDELHNGDRIWVFDQKGKWLGIVYDAPNLGCGPIESDRLVPYEGKKGWVHENWVEYLAG